MDNDKNNWNLTADLILDTPQKIEGLIIGIPYLILNVIGTILKISLLSLL